LAHGLNLRLGNDGGHAREGHPTVDARRRQNAEFPIQPFAQEQIAGEKRQREFHGSIAPLPNGGVQGQENLKSFAA
jgi:hypothetical protein